MQNKGDGKLNTLVYGRNPVTEALRGDRPVEKVLVQNGAGGSVGKIIALAKNKGLRIQTVSKKELDELTGGASHQGVACLTAEFEYADLDEVLEMCDSSSILVLLDEIEDPHNLGAVMRTAECVGVKGIVITKHRSCGLTETVAKTSAGAIEHIPCVRVTNMSNAIDRLKSEGFWICAADMDGASMWSCDLKGKLAIVIGSEGRGVSRLVKEKCDFVASIPMEGKINSLNASNAAAVLLYEALRQRSL